MIKVVNKKEEPKIYKAMCCECYSELEYEECDTRIGSLGGRELTCPVCNETVFVDEPEGIVLDSSNIEFPRHFMKMSDKAVDISDPQIQEWVQQCLFKAERDEADYVHYAAGSGNTIVDVFKYDEEYIIYAAKNYWECSIPR